MIGRVTQQTTRHSTLANLQLNLSAMSRLQEKMSSGKVISRPSDDPSGTAQTLQLRSGKRAAEQYARNVDNGIGWLTTVDSTLQTSLTALRRARDLTVQGASSGTMSPAAREAIATELEGISDSLLSSANTRYLGRSVFAGTSDSDHAFSDASGTPPFTSTAAAGATVERRTALDTTVRVDSDGVAVFGEGAWVNGSPGSGSVFGLLDQIAADLRAGVEVGTRLDDIDTRMDQMLSELANVGTRYSTLKAAQSTIDANVMSLTGQISAVEDIDLAEVIMDLQSQEVAYQAALGATTRVLQPTLLDFLK